MAPREKREVVRSELRLPTDLYAEITDEADQHERSLNAEYVVLLREAMAARKRRRKS